MAATARTTNRPLGAPPAPPQEPPSGAPDDGPMRRELLRQIGLLERRLTGRTEGWQTRRTTPRRGPALLSNAELEVVRDELLAALSAD